VTSFTEDTDGNKLVNHILRIENLEEELSQVNRDQGWNFPFDYSFRANVSEHKHYREYFDGHPDLIDRVAKKFAADIKLGGYKY
jgi:hypothetical protein